MTEYKMDFWSEVESRWAHFDSPFIVTVGHVKAIIHDNGQAEILEPRYKWMQLKQLVVLEELGHLPRHNYPFYPRGY